MKRNSFSHSRTAIYIGTYSFNIDQWKALHPEYSLPEDCVTQTYTEEYRIGYTEKGEEKHFNHPWLEGDLYIKVARDDFYKINQLPNWKRWARLLMIDKDMDGALSQMPHHKVAFLIALITQEQPLEEMIQSLWDELKTPLSFPIRTLERWNAISQDNHVPIIFR